METTTNCPLARALAARMRAARDELTTRWLERIGDRVALDPNRIFPTEDLLDHVPLLIEGIADYVEDPTRAVSADVPVIAKAMELGALRHSQGFDEYELLKEYEIFGGILFAFLSRVVDEIDEPCSRGELLVCSHRLFHAVALIQQATTTHYLHFVRNQVTEREERLRAFNRTLTHEFRNRLGALLGAGQLLKDFDLPEPKRREIGAIVERNARGMQGVLENLLELSRSRGDARHHRRVHLPAAAAEAVRELREFARGEGVEVRVAADLPEVEVPAAAVELCLTNLVSNAVKYADRRKPERWVEVRGHLAPMARGGDEVVVAVRDNGVGVPEAERSRLFGRFFRARDLSVTRREGTGLGLSIVRETVEALGGRVWAEFPEEGSVFAFALPCRRAADVGADGADRAPVGG